MARKAPPPPPVPTVPAAPKPSRPKRPRLADALWYGFDTENDSTGHVNLTALVGEDGLVRVWHKAGELRHWINQLPGKQQVIIICHNLEYDLVNEFGAYYPYLHLNYLHSRLISARYGRATFWDSFNHFRMALKKIGEPFGVKKLAYDPTSPQYVTTDARIPMVAMTYTRDYLKSIGGQIGATAGSSAVSVWKAMTRERFLCGPMDSDWLRKGYYGGRVELFRRRGEGNVRGYDINSMYPFCMMGMFPINLESDRKFTRAGGMIECTIKVPRDLPVAPLVYRQDNGSLTYPVGTFRGVWTYDEVRFAEAHGAKIQTIHHAYGSSEMVRPFEGFVKLIYQRRKESANPAEREVLKVVLNSLYGKLGSRNVSTRVVSRFHVQNKYPERLEEVRWIDAHRGLLEFTAPPQNFVYIPWGALITARARILLTTYLMQARPENLIYCDTDSIYGVGLDYPVTGDLGGLKLEREARLMIVKQPKAYRLDDFYKVKGIPRGRTLTPEEYDRLLPRPRPQYDADGNIVIDFAKEYFEAGMTDFEAPVRFRQSLATSLGRPNQWIRRSKVRRTEYRNKRLQNGRYLPPYIFRP